MFSVKLASSDLRMRLRFKRLTQKNGSLSFCVCALDNAREQRRRRANGNGSGKNSARELGTAKRQLSLSLSGLGLPKLALHIQETHRTSAQFVHSTAATALLLEICLSPRHSVPLAQHSKSSAWTRRKVLHTK